MDKEVECIICLDAETRDKSHRMTTFSDGYSDVLEDYLRWVGSNGFKPEDIRYANIFAADGEHVKHMGDLLLQDDGSAAICPAPEGSTLQPHLEKPGIMDRLLDLGWHIKQILSGD